MEKSLLTAIADIRKRLSDEDISSMNLVIDASGRTMSGDLKVEFRLSTEYGPNTAGGNLEAVVEEFIRRTNWSSRHEALCLSPPNEVSF